MDDIAGGQSTGLRSEFEFLDRNGTTRWGDVQIAAVRNESGELDSLLITVLDISDRREIEMELIRQFTFLQALLDTIPNPIFYKGAHTRFLGCNRAYETFFGIGRGSFIGKRVLDLDYLPAEVRQAYQAEDEQIIAEGSRTTREVAMQAADGSLRDMLYSVSGFRAPDGTPGGLIGVISQCRESRFSRQHEPRNPHPDECHHRHDPPRTANRAHAAAEKLSQQG